MRALGTIGLLGHSITGTESERPIHNITVQDSKIQGIYIIELSLLTIYATIVSTSLVAAVFNVPLQAEIGCETREKTLLTGRKECQPFIDWRHCCFSGITFEFTFCQYSVIASVCSLLLIQACYKKSEEKRKIWFGFGFRKSENIFIYFLLLQKTLKTFQSFLL